MVRLEAFLSLTSIDHHQSSMISTTHSRKMASLHTNLASSWNLSPLLNGSGKRNIRNWSTSSSIISPTWICRSRGALAVVELIAYHHASTSQGNIRRIPKWHDKREPHRAQRYVSQQFVLFETILMCALVSRSVTNSNDTTK